MPPKVKITKDEILKAALGIVRKGGALALNARALADALGCSTQPVFSNYPGMDELRADVDRAAYELYREYLSSGAKRSDVPKYKAFGLAYIEFAKEEPELFRLLFMCDRSGGKKEEIVHEGSTHEPEQLACFLVGLSGGGDGNVHTTQLLDLIVIDLREDDLFLKTHGVVASAVECICGNTAEVTDTGKSNIEQTIEELPHTVLTQGDLNADMHALTELEVSDGLACYGSNGVLTGDRGDLFDNIVKCLCIVLAIAAADGNDDLVDLGDLHDGLVLELLHQSRSNFLNILFLHSCHGQLSPFSDFGAALATYAQLLVCNKLVAYANTLVALRADELDLADIDGSFHLDDAAVLSLLLCLLVLGGNADALNGDFAVLGVCG